MHLHKQVAEQQLSCVRCKAWCHLSSALWHTTFQNDKKCSHCVPSITTSTMAKRQTTLFNPKCNLQRFVPSIKKQRKKLVPLDEEETKCLFKSSCFEAKFVCDGCNRHFINSQGLGNHKKIVSDFNEHENKKLVCCLNVSLIVVSWSKICVQLSTVGSKDACRAAQWGSAPNLSFCRTNTSSTAHPTEQARREEAW